MDRITLGRTAEDAATEYIKQQGYQIIQRNCRFMDGEIDIIAEDREELIFVEVRSRKSKEFGLPQETVNYKKQQKLRKLAGRYLKGCHALQRNCRFDVIAVLFDGRGQIESLEHIMNAF